MLLLVSAYFRHSRVRAIARTVMAEIDTTAIAIKMFFHTSHSHAADGVRSNSLVVSRVGLISK